MSCEVQRSRTFSVLQPICSVLFQHRDDPRQLGELLRGLAAVVREADRGGLQGCLDYVLFPLLLAADSITLLRQQARGPGHPLAAPVPAMAADQAAEAALTCLAELLQRCHCQQGQQLASMLQRLLPVVMLPPAVASEEVRHQALLAVGAALDGVRQAPAAVHEALCSIEEAPLLGQLTVAFLQTAEAELQQGSTGSKVIRTTALQDLLVLISSVSTPWAAAGAAADALSFFLPGTVVGLTKALIAAGSSTQRGPAKSSAAAITALRGVAAILTTCLGNAVMPAGIRQDAAGTPLAAAMSPLEQLQQLSTRSHMHHSQPVAESRSPPSQAAAQVSPKPAQRVHMRVERDAAWVHSTVGHLEELLATALPPLMLHPRPEVRQALAECEWAPTASSGEHQLRHRESTALGAHHLRCGEHARAHHGAHDSLMHPGFLAALQVLSSC